MSDLVAVACDDVETAKQVRKELLKLVDELSTEPTFGMRIPVAASALELDDAVVVTPDAVLWVPLRR